MYIILSVLQCVAVYCALCCSVCSHLCVGLDAFHAYAYNMMHVRYAMQCAVVYYIVLQCVAVCCSVLHAFHAYVYDVMHVRYAM